MPLNKDQLKAAKYIANWWQCNSTYLVLGGRGGTGKTHLVNHILPLLKGCTPLLLAPTNESVDQLRDKLDSPEDYEIRTIHSALGILPTTLKKEIKFKQGKIPSLWEDYNLCIIDESSMVSSERLQTLISIGIKILFLGHEKQLPSIEENRNRFDLCEAPVFCQGWDIITLEIPMRNKGELWNFNNYVEAMIDDDFLTLPANFNISKKKLKQEICCKEGAQNLLEGKTKLVAWTNNKVDFYNKEIRKSLFGERSSKFKYLPKDRIILIQPCSVIANLQGFTETGLASVMNSKKEVIPLYSNTKAVILNCSEAVIKLRYDLHVDCYKIKVSVKGETYTLYEAKDPSDLVIVAAHYEHLAWGKKTIKAKQKAYKIRHFILSCFVNLKHYYAATSHRLQGASIPNIIVLYDDIMKNKNRIERQKCLYVATSRAIDNLSIYKGV